MSSPVATARDFLSDGGGGDASELLRWPSVRARAMWRRVGGPRRRGFREGKLRAEEEKWGWEAPRELMRREGNRGRR